MTIFKAIEMSNYKDEPLKYVGVYVLRWRPEWGEPTVGFVDDDDKEDELAAITAERDALREALNKIASGKDHDRGVIVDHKYFVSFAEIARAALTDTISPDDNTADE